MGDNLRFKRGVTQTGVFFMCVAAMFHSDQLFAQQETYLTHAAYNRLSANPGFAGYGGKYELSLNHHRQWLNLKDFTGVFPGPGGIPPDGRFPAPVAPVTSLLSFSAPVTRCESGEKKVLGGYAFTAIQDAIGYEQNTHFKMAAAAEVRFTSNTFLRLGIEMNHLTKRLNTSMLRALQMPDPMIPAGTNPSDSRWIPGAGIVFSHSGHRKFFSGLGITGLYRPVFRYSNAAGNPVLIQTATHVQWMSGAEFRWRNNPAWKAFPTAIVRSVNDGNGWVMPQGELQCEFRYDDRFSAGSAIRFQKNGWDALCLFLGFSPNGFRANGTGNLRIGYSFDLTLQSLRFNSRNTHEIQINYTFERFCRMKRRIEHPRDLKFNKGGITGSSTNTRFCTLNEH